MELYVASTLNKTLPCGDDIPLRVSCCTGERLRVWEHTPCGAY